MDNIEFEVFPLGGFPEPKYEIPPGCRFAHSVEKGDEVTEYTFSTNWGVMNTYELNEETGGYRIKTITFPDGYMINVDELLEE